MKYMDIKPVCPTSHLHYGIRRFFRNLPSRGIMNDSMAVIFVENKDDPCKSRIIKEVLDNRITMPGTADQIAERLIRHAYRSTVPVYVPPERDRVIGTVENVTRDPNDPESFIATINLLP